MYAYINQNEIGKCQFQIWQMFSMNHLYSGNNGIILIVLNTNVFKVRFFNLIFSKFNHERMLILIF